MDMGDGRNFETTKEKEDDMSSHPQPHPTNMSSDWQFGGQNSTNRSMGPVALQRLDLMDSFSPTILNHDSNSFGIRPVHLPILDDVSLIPPNQMQRSGTFLSTIPRMVPQSLSQFPSDSGFIERAARFSCFNESQFGAMANPFGIVPEHINLSQQETFAGGGFHSSGLLKDFTKKNAGGDDSDEVGFSCGREEELPHPLTTCDGIGEEPSSTISNTKGIGSKKRKRIGQQENGDEIDIANKIQASDMPKEEYIHMRARRGQATNSHSLAERVRREKISERMKFLQDLVPGCSKVTGKAVMLDEIINYVQSLQRQVEFLSMKLATVNPRVDFNAEGLLMKDILHSQAGASSVHGYLPELSMAFSSLVPSQPGLNQTVHPGMTGSSDNILHRPPFSPQLIAMTEGGRYKEPASQVQQNMWQDDELHNVVVHMGFNSTADPHNQNEDNNDLNITGTGLLPPGHMKREL